MEIAIVFRAGQPKYVAIYAQLKEKIIEQSLAAHTRMPAKRTFATQLGVSVHTVQQAYEQLLSEGYLYSRERSGYYVAPYDVDWQPMPPSRMAFEQIPLPQIDYNFKNGQVDAHAFPLKLWQTLYKQQLDARIVPNDAWQGHAPLRAQIADYVNTAKGLACEPNQVFVYSGTQQQLRALCHFFGNVPIAMEEPGFRRASAVFAHYCTPHYVHVDDKGATVPMMPCKLYYVTPAHQFPLGNVMPLDRRIALLKWAQETDSYLIEDDYDSEFRYKGKPIPPLAQLDQLQRVIYCGTFSKTLMPSLRISYIVLPSPLVARFQAYYADEKTTVSHIDQRVVSAFLREGHFARHVAKMRTLYRKKREQLLQAIAHHLGAQYDIIGDEAGLHVVVKLPAGMTEQQAIAAAAQVGIALDPVSTSYQTRDEQQYVMLGYGAIERERIDEGIARLAAAWRAC